MPNIHLCETKMKPDRLDRIMRDLEVLQNDADGIIDTYVNEVLARHPLAASWGEAKQYLIGPAGGTVNRVEALKLVRRALTGKDR
jgi:hypothetical protein